MFTGIITDIGIIRSIEQRGDMRVVIGCSYEPSDIAMGASIACSGVCLTVVDKGTDDRGHWFAVDVSGETVSRTAQGQWSEARRLNLERALKVGDELGGHIVTGHIDATGTLDRREDEGDWSTFWFSVPGHCIRQMARKGSVAVDGISLTLVEVDEETFSVALIPHTLAVTTLGSVQPGETVNIETDVLAKYVEQQLDGSCSTPGP